MENEKKPEIPAPASKEESNIVKIDDNVSFASNALPSDLSKIEFVDDTPEPPVAAKPTVASKPTVGAAEVAQKQTFVLPQKKVRIAWVPRSHMGISDPAHPLYKGIAPNAVKKLTAGLLRNGSFNNPLTDEEKRFFESPLSGMGFSPGDLSVNKKHEENFWAQYYVSVPARGLPLDLSNPKDYLDYCVLRSNRNKVAMSKRDLGKGSGTHIFVIEDPNEESINKAQNMSKTAQAYTLLGTIQGDVYKLRHVVLEYRGGVYLTESNKNDTGMLFTQVGTIIEQDPDSFLRIMRDEHFEAKLDIELGLEKGIIRKKNHFYYQADGEKLSLHGNTNTLEDAIQFITHPRNYEWRMNLRKQVYNKEGII